MLHYSLLKLEARNAILQALGWTGYQIAWIFKSIRRILMFQCFLAKMAANLIGMWISIPEAEAIRIEMHCQRSDTLRIHVTQLVMCQDSPLLLSSATRHDLIGNRTQCSSTWTNTKQIIWCRATQRDLPSPWWVSMWLREGPVQGGTFIHSP